MFLAIANLMPKKAFFTKRTLLQVVLFVFLVSLLASQQITKFAVVDTAKVYQAYFRNSAAVRSYETKREEFKAELDRLVAELQDLNEQRLDAARSGDEVRVLNLEAEITRKTNYVTDYTNAKNSELDSLKKSLEDNDSFYKKLYDTLARIAEKGGYSMILNLQESTSILWFSPSVDITDDVISALGLVM